MAWGSFGNIGSRATHRAFLSASYAPKRKFQLQTEAERGEENLCKVELEGKNPFALEIDVFSPKSRKGATEIWARKTLRFL